VILRQWTLPSVAVLAITAGIWAVAALVLCLRAPGLFLGPEGVWVLGALRGFLPQRFRATAPGAATGLPAAAFERNGPIT